MRAASDRLTVGMGGQCSMGRGVGTERARARLESKDAGLLPRRGYPDTPQRPAVYQCVAVGARHRVRPAPLHRNAGLQPRRVLCTRPRSSTQHVSRARAVGTE